MPFGNSMQRSRTTDAPAVLQSQRDCVCQPRVARNELPWVAADSVSNPNGVVSRFHGLGATPLGLFRLATMSQGSSFLATLGFWPESLWDSVLEFPKGIRLQPASVSGWEKPADIRCRCGVFKLKRRKRRAPLPTTSECTTSGGALLD